MPAIFAITSDAYIVYTSNIFAILGLRALFFALAAMVVDRFKYSEICAGAHPRLHRLKDLPGRLLSQAEKFPAEWSLSNYHRAHRQRRRSIRSGRRAEAAPLPPLEMTKRYAHPSQPSRNSPRLLQVAADRLKRLRALFDAVVQKMDPVHIVALGYSLYVVLGFLALSAPWAQAAPVAALDRLFMAASAVTTTGLATHDPGGSYTFFGELALLLMMQAGALGYLTLGTFVAIALSNRMHPRRAEIARAAFGLPEGFDVSRLIKHVVIFTFSIEAMGVVLLYPQFVIEGVENPLWMAIFHSVSSFCTAGVSLFATNFESFRDNPLLLMTISLLAWSGAIGFLVLSESLDVMRRKRMELGFTSRVALVVTAGYTFLVTLIVLCVEPAIQALPQEQRLWNALFMTMAAGTTVGFNTVPVAALAPAVVAVLYVVMVFASSPGGTGGGPQIIYACGLDRTRHFNVEAPQSRNLPWP